MISFPKTRIDSFIHDKPHLRWGQHFFQYMELHKCSNPEDQVFLNRLYNAADDVAKTMVADRTDPDN